MPRPPYTQSISFVSGDEDTDRSRPSFVPDDAPSRGQTWPALPERNAAVNLPAQEWPLRPGPREVKVLVHYPQGELARVDASTGLMLTLHNWGGVDCVGTAALKNSPTG